MKVVQHPAYLCKTHLANTGTTTKKKKKKKGKKGKKEKKRNRSGTGSITSVGLLPTDMDTA
jgi:hypothetical protein